MQNDWFDLEVLGQASALWQYRVPGSDKVIDIPAPVLEIDGQAVVLELTDIREVGPAHPLPQGVYEYRWSGDVVAQGDLTLEIVFQIASESPVMRFQYILHSITERRLTKVRGKDALLYTGLSLGGSDSVKEIRFSEFNPLFHSFLLSERPVESSAFSAEQALMGPLLVAKQSEFQTLFAYEHGSQYPDAFLQYHLYEDGTVALEAVKGNYYHGQVVGPDAPFETVWFQLACIQGNEDVLAETYRTWVLKWQSPNTASRTPYVFYNTWNYQERVKHWQKRPYLADMNETRMLAEIEVAHRMGIDVFVIDTGWYEKTGDWRVSTERFPNGLAPITAKLNEYGMKLGLWFNPLVAAMSSQLAADYADCRMSSNGKISDPQPVWETEPSYWMSLVSRYWEAFADELIRCYRELGVTYFKWDAIGQHGGDGANLFHGTDENDPKERRDCYGFLLGRYMSRVIDKLCTECPEAIVDFDITEGGRTVGLQFLSSGKYFLINNGPYNHDYNMPIPTDGNPNLFFFPGPARTWICRTPLTYDKWFPSVLFLTHYLPDDTHREGWGEGHSINGENQWLALASLVLGQNGIWGDLCAISGEGVARFGETLASYKQVRDDITEASPVRVGEVGGSPEVHEKILPRTGRGVVCLFATSPGTYTYVTRSTVVSGIWHNDGVTVTLDTEGHAVITATFASGQYAKLVFFGVE